MFVMKTCPYCEYVERQVEGNPQYEVIDISKHVRNLKQFLDLRDNNPAFDEAKKIGDLGVPCYVLEVELLLCPQKMLVWSRCLTIAMGPRVALTEVGVEDS